MGGKQTLSDVASRSFGRHFALALFDGGEPRVRWFALNEWIRPPNSSDAVLSIVATSRRTPLTAREMIFCGLRLTST